MVCAQRGLPLRAAIGTVFTRLIVRGCDETSPRVKTILVQHTGGVWSGRFATYEIGAAMRPIGQLGTQGTRPSAIQQLPMELLEMVLQPLPPPDLRQAGHVSTHWRAASASPLDKALRLP